VLPSGRRALRDCEGAGQRLLATAANGNASANFGGKFRLRALRRSGQTVAESGSVRFPQSSFSQSRNRHPSSTQSRFMASFLGSDTAVAVLH
jgi:hypothetical protein